jgi:hypothetical protein
MVMLLRILFLVVCAVALSACSDNFDTYGEPPAKKQAHTNSMEQFDIAPTSSLPANDR